MITIAAELPGSEELCRWAVARNISVSLGHQMASAKDVRRLVSCGASLATHLGNGMPNMIHRHQNSLWPLLAEDRISAMLILDGQHLPDDAIVAMVRAKSAAGIIITSDAAPVAGLDDGNYSWGSTNVRVCSGRVRHSTLPCLAGSGALMLQCMNHLAQIKTSKHGWLLSPDELMQVGCQNPLRALPSLSEAQIAQVQKKTMLAFDEEKRTFQVAYAPHTTISDKRIANETAFRGTEPGLTTDDIFIST